MSEQRALVFQEVMSGRAGGPMPRLLRGTAAAAEPFYAAAIRARNGLFDSGLRRAGRLARPVISVGNITTGGTGKTPVVRWLASRLRDAGRHVAILSRGYKSATNGLADEQMMLDALLNAPPLAPILLRAHPRRLAAGLQAIRENPTLDVFVLDDGFQHRMAARDLDLVLIDAAHPFGFDHLLPRGLLREPLSGLRRAGAFILTHADRVAAGRQAEIERVLRRHNPAAPLFRCIHRPAGLRGPGNSSSVSLADFAVRPFFAFCGIGSPESFHQHFTFAGPRYVGHRWFPDHHRYTADDLASLRDAARTAGAEVLVTTEKDWVKVKNLPSGDGPDIWRLDVAIEFMGDDEARLLDLIRRVLNFTAH